MSAAESKLPQPPWRPSDWGKYSPIDYRFSFDGRGGVSVQLQLETGEWCEIFKMVKPGI